jgi:outer membrane protein assembly factor BamB
MNTVHIGLLVAMLAIGADAWATECHDPVSLVPEAAPIAWRSSGANDVTIDGDDAFLASFAGGIRRLSAETGQVYWAYPVAVRGMPDYAVFPQTVAVHVGPRTIAFLDRRTGIEIKRIDLDQPILHFAGPPLIAVTSKTASDKENTTLVRLSSTGDLLTRRKWTPVRDVYLLDGIIAIESPGRGPYADDILTGFDAVHLEPLWSTQRFALVVQNIDHRFYVSDVFWKSTEAIEPRTGSKTAIPARDPYSTGGSGDFDLQIVASVEAKGPFPADKPWEPSYKRCQELRRNDPVSGRTVWRLDLPFGITATLRAGERVYIAGSADADHRYIVAIDRDTGQVLHSWTGVPVFHELRLAGPIIIGYELDGPLLAMPLTEVRP